MKQMMKYAKQLNKYAYLYHALSEPMYIFLGHGIRLIFLSEGKSIAIYL